MWPWRLTMKQPKSASLAKWPIEGYIYRGLSQFTGHGLLNQLLQKRNWIPWFGINVSYYANKVKDGKGVLDTEYLHRCLDNNSILFTASRGLTVGAEFDYVVVKPAGSDRKYVSSLWTLCQAFLKNLVGKMLEVLATYHGKNWTISLQNTHGILKWWIGDPGEHVTPWFRYWYRPYRPGFGRWLQCRDCQWPRSCCYC